MTPTSLSQICVSLVRVSEGGGWVSNLFNDPNKSLTEITGLSGPSRLENRPEEPNMTLNMQGWQGMIQI